MSAFNAVASLLADRKINTKIALGFACVLTILAAVSGTAWFAFRASADGLATYAQRVAVVDIARDIDRTFLNLRRFVREFAFTGVQDNVASAKQEQAALHDLLKQGLNITLNPNRRARLENIAVVTDSISRNSTGWSWRRVNRRDCNKQAWIRPVSRNAAGSKC